MSGGGGKVSGHSQSLNGLSNNKREETGLAAAICLVTGVACSANETLSLETLKSPSGVEDSGAGSLQ